MKHGRTEESPLSFRQVCQRPSYPFPLRFDVVPGCPAGLPERLSQVFPQRFDVVPGCAKRGGKTWEGLWQTCGRWRMKHGRTEESPLSFRQVCQRPSHPFPLPGIFRTSARNLPEVCQEPSGRLPGTFRTSARQASGRPRNDGDLPEVCQHPSLVFPTVFLTRCLPWEGGSARAWQTSGRFLADLRKVPSAGKRILLIPVFY